MPSDVPKDGRCGARVSDKVGLEVHDSVLGKVFVDSDRRPEDVATDSDVVNHVDGDEPVDEYVDGDDELDDGYDEEMVAVVVSDGEHEKEVDPTWDDVLPLLREEWYTEAVIVERETDDAIEHDRVTIEDDDPYVTNRGVELQGYCLRWPMDNGTCYVHQGPAEKGNTRRTTHGFYMKRSKFFNWLKESGREKDVEFIHEMVDSWVEDAPFDWSNSAKVNVLYRKAVDQLRLWYSVDEYVDKSDGPHNESGEYSGLAYTRIVGTNDDGEEIEVFDESPLNLPYSRLDRDVRGTLKDMGIYDSPEKEQAEATQSLAQALSEDNS